MYKYYIVPDATKLASHAALYSEMQLLYDPRSESDAYALINPKMKGEIQKAFSLEFTVLPSNVHYDDFYKRKTVVIVYDDNEYIQEFVVSAAPVDFFKQRKVSCTSPLAYLCDTVQAPDEKNEIVNPTSGDNAMYIQVPQNWYGNISPVSEGWYERSWDAQNERWKYSKTRDSSADTAKLYYIAAEGSNANYSGMTYTRSAATSETIGEHISRLLDVHNSQVDPFKRIYPGKLNPDDSGNHDFKSSNFRTTWDSLETDITNEFGKYFFVRRADDGNLYLDWLDIAQLASSSVPLVEFGNNMIEMSEQDNGDDDIFTVLVPVGKDGLTVADASGHDSASGSGEINPYIASWSGNRRYVVVSPSAVSRFGYIVKTQTFSDVEDASTLYDRAVKYIRNNYDTHPEYQVKAVDLHYINGAHRITVYDRCRLLSKWHGVDVQDLYVISAEYDHQNPDNDTFTIGVPTSDREATNKRLTSQTNSTSNNAKSTAASSGSGMSRMHSILEDYIHVTEWGLELNSNLRNTVESNDGMMKTRFEQTDEYITLFAQKVFGSQAEEDKAGFRLVPVSMRAGKHPDEEGWYEYGYDKNVKKNCFTLTTDHDPVPGKDYYYRGIVTRISDITVDAGGIHQRVLGNYETATACASWIEANEGAILAITGHIHVNEDGEIIVDSGAGFRTGHTETVTRPHYSKVIKSNYYAKDGSGSLVSPVQRVWYERRKSASGRWLGEGKADSTINDEYYQRSTDTVADLNKVYYYKSAVEEEFYSEYGVYDENSLSAGVVARIVNNPSFVPVERQYYNQSLNPSTQGWYEYNESTGEFGLTLDTSIDHSKTYYTIRNNAQHYTDIWGEHIVVGRTPGYSGMDKTTQSRIDRYVSDNNLDGTITEIASDVVYVHALFAKFIDFESAHGIDINVNWIIADYIGCNEMDVITPTGDGYLQTNTFHSDDGTITDFRCDSLSIEGVTFGSIEFEDGGAEAGNNPEEIVMGFGTITTEGDTVKIPYRMAGMGDFDTEHVLSFDKPASLGKAVWSDGKIELYTIGGWAATPKWKFYTANIDIPTNYLTGKTRDNSDRLAYSRVGRTLTSNSILWSKPTLRAYMEVTGEDYDKNGDSVSFGHDAADDSPLVPGWSKYIYLDATLPYNDGWDHARSQMDWPSTMQALGERTTLTIKYPGETPSDGQKSTTLALLDVDTKGTSGYVRLYNGYVNNNNRGNLIGAIQVGDWYSSGYDAGANTLSIDPSSNVTLDYSASKTVTATTKKANGTTVTKSVKITAPADNSTDPKSGSITISTDTSAHDAKGNDNVQIFTNVAFTKDKWYYFTVKCTGDTMKETTKTYAIKGS